MPTSVKSNEEQQECIAAFRELLGSAAEHSDTRLKQFLVARNWDINAAKKQLDETLAWRRDNNVDVLPCATRQNQLPLLLAIRGFESFDDGNVEVKPGLSDSVIRIINLMGGDCIHKVDREGHPVLIDRTGYHKARELCTQITSEQITQYQISCNEFLSRVVMPECSQRAGQTIYQETVIFDCNNMGISQFQMGALQLLKTVLDIIQHYYPETLNRMFVVNAPTIFVAMWKIIKPWLEPRTLEKIHIASRESTAETLLQYIVPENLPDFLGGTCTCSHMPGGCVPSVVMGNVPALEATTENEKTTTVYNSDVMEKAKSDKSLCGPID